MSQDFYYGTGRRKKSVARTRLYEGDGRIIVNDRPLSDYFPRAALQMVIQQPLKLTKTDSKIDVQVNVSGGGLTGQAEAIRHGISRALQEYDPEMRTPLKKAGHLTRDSRATERKKYGQPGARAKFQYSKR